MSELMMLSAATAHAVSTSISTSVPCRAASGQHTCNRFRKPQFFRLNAENRNWGWEGRSDANLLKRRGCQS
jgi:hypothetical protein